MAKKRYELKVGKFGSYFFDSKEKKDLTLTEVLSLLNLEIKNPELQLISDLLMRIETRVANHHREFLTFYKSEFIRILGCIKHKLRNEFDKHGELLKRKIDFPNEFTDFIVNLIKGILKNREANHVQI